LLLALAVADDKGPLGVNVTTARASERIALEPLRGPIDIVADPYAGRIELRSQKPQPRLVAQIAHHAGAICPTVKAIGSTIELTCRTRRFEAVLTTEGKKQFLDIQELRGLPWREGLAGPPFYHYEPLRSGLGGPCPGTNAASRGECALRAGKQLEAATQFRSTLDGGDFQIAALRLGDLALGTGDPATAIGWYRRAGTAGTFGRLARARICELDGACLSSAETQRRVFDPHGMVDPMRAEMTIRAIRVEALEGRLGEATRMMWHGIRAGSLAWVCREGGEVICRRVLLEYMREAATAPLPKKEPEKQEKDAPDAEAQPKGVAGALAGALASATEIANTLASAAGIAAAPAATLDAGAPAAKAIANNESAKASPDGGAAPTATAAKAPAAPVKAPAAKEPAPPAHDEPDEPTEPEMAIEAYLALPAWDRGPLAPELSEASADLASHIGAPVFGGNILSSVVADIPPESLSGHLAKAAELYLEGDDIARTRLVIEYARTRLGNRMTARWIALEKRLAARVASEEEAAARPPLKIDLDAEAIARELAAARAASARARIARAETAPKKQGDQP
jgi:hypothetical protein